MQYDDAAFDELMKTLTDSFNVLADEVQLLSDRNLVLQHKLGFAREQYQQLADQYAPADVDISNTLAALQLPPSLQLQTPDRATFVPLPPRRPGGSKQQTAEAIRDGRRVSQLIARARGWRRTSELGGHSMSGTANSIMRTSRRGTSATTLLEQDFTIPGKMSRLQCPFASMPGAVNPPDHVQLPTASIGAGSEYQITNLINKDTTPHQSADPICAAMYNETHASPPQSIEGGSAKCPIRYLDQHSPEEVAQYFETHKHEIPRSHEVCVKRYQRNENDIRKLDAKYGNIVSMIQGLGAKHQPMLPSQVPEEEDVEGEKKSNQRVENWAKAVSDDGVNHDDATDPSDDEDRESRFDRNLKEVRLGESPSRPWGIPVPFAALQSQERLENERPVSPPAPVSGTLFTPPPAPSRPAGKCPFGHGQKSSENPPSHISEEKAETSPAPGAQPTFFKTPDITRIASNPGPQMVFTGPVFIGYPIDQAITLMQQWQSGTARGS